MIMLPDSLAFNPEFEARKEELREKRENYALLLEEYAELTGPVKDNLQNEYMLKLGKKEYKLFALQVEILRHKRMIALYQSAKNRGEAITQKEVEKVIDQEFLEFKAQMEKHQKEIEEADEYLQKTFLSQKEEKKLKKLYHRLVMRLHPDLNPNQTEAEEHLWHLVDNAYKNHAWEELELLGDMLDEMDEDGSLPQLKQLNPFDTIKAEIEKYQQKIEALKKQLAETKKHPPYSYKKLLENPTAIRARRQEIDTLRKQYQTHLATLQEMLAELKNGQ